MKFRDVRKNRDKLWFRLKKVEEKHEISAHQQQYMMCTHIRYSAIRFLWGTTETRNDTFSRWKQTMWTCLISALIKSWNAKKIDRVLCLLQFSWNAMNLRAYSRCAPTSRSPTCNLSPLPSACMTSQTWVTTWRWVSLQLIDQTRVWRHDAIGSCRDDVTLVRASICQMTSALGGIERWWQRTSRRWEGILYSFNIQAPEMSFSVVFLFSLWSSIH